MYQNKSLRGKRDEKRRIAPGFWIVKMERCNSWTCVLRIGQRWFYTNFWTMPTCETQRGNIEQFCRGLGFPTLSAAISASRGNRHA